MNIAALGAIMTHKFGPEIYRQWNRTVTLGRRLTVVPGAGKDCSWPVEFSGITAEAAQEGEDIDSTEYTNDTDDDVHESWATYRSAFQVSEQAFDAAVTSGGDPEILFDLFADKVMTHSATIAKKIESDLIVGTGTRTVRGNSVPTIVGLLGGALATSGTHAGIAISGAAEWASNHLSNGAVDRPLTAELLAAAARAVFDDSGADFGGFLATTAAIADKYEGLWGQRLQVNLGGAADIGATNLAWRGHEIVKVADMTTKNLVLVDPGELELRFLPFSQMTRREAVTFMENVRKVAGTADGRSFNLTNLPVRIALLGKAGDSLKCTLRTTVQLVVKRPNRMCRISDIAE
jgi:hypothetical protein